jgi:hypothetical protein
LKGPFPPLPDKDISPVAEKLIQPLTGKLLPNEWNLIVGIKII